MFGHPEIADAVAQHAAGSTRSAAAAVAQMTLSSYHLSTDPDEVPICTHSPLGCVLCVCYCSYREPTRPPVRVPLPQVDLDLVEKVISYIHDHRGGEIGPQQPGAVLVFLPGWDEINRLKERLQAHRVFGDGRRALVLPLHSMVPSADQRRVFQRAPPGVRKARACAGM